MDTRIESGTVETPFDIGKIIGPAEAVHRSDPFAAYRKQRNKIRRQQHTVREQGAIAVVIMNAAGFHLFSGAGLQKLRQKKFRVRINRYFLFIEKKRYLHCSLE
jgi:hypothetical protein